MKFKSLNTLSNTEVVAGILFTLYILFPINVPESIKPYVSSPMGLVFMFAITMSLFIYTNPILGVLYIFVVYETLRRSKHHKNFLNTPSRHQIGKSGRTLPQSQVYHYDNVVPQKQNIVPQKQIQYPLYDDIGAGFQVEDDYNAVHSLSLEEEIVQSHAPVGVSEPVQFSQSTFSPVSDKLSTSASLF